MSVNAALAYENGERPISKWYKYDVLGGSSRDLVAALNLDRYSVAFLKEMFLEPVAWHHTSRRYNVTDLYALRGDWFHLSRAKSRLLLDNPHGWRNSVLVKGFSPHARGYKSVLSHCYLSTKQLPRSFMRAHTSQARASFPDRSLLCSVLSGWYPPPGLK